LTYSQDWVKIGEKSNLTGPLSDITSIDNDILARTQHLERASLAKRMSWAAFRETKRPEDYAYCLIGLFSVNMPMLYGEGGERAFQRLQEEIMKQSDDQLLFAWVDEKAWFTAEEDHVVSRRNVHLDAASILPSHSNSRKVQTR
jgi:hypothetical protein